MQESGNRCERVGLEGPTSTFTSFHSNERSACCDVLRRMDHFLAALGYPDGEPTAEQCDEWIPCYRDALRFLDELIFPERENALAARWDVLEERREGAACRLHTSHPERIF